MKQLVHPHSNYKFYWDMLIIVLALVNAIYVPIEITYQTETNVMDSINYLFDLIFLTDIIITFRTI